MRSETTRRRFLQAAAGSSAVAAFGQLGFLQTLPPVSAAQAKVDSRLVRLDTGIEPLVRLLEETPQDQLLEAVAAKIRHGTSYQEVLTALMLASVRNVQPRPAVGFKFHAVLVINSAHLASLASADSDRWLPIFWALDYYKGRQLEEERGSGWKMGPVDETAVPAPSKAREAFIAAMDQWDEPAADAAVAGLARSAGAQEIVELFYRYGARDFRSIGHKAIFVANSWRTLQCIGWQHCEPVLRSLAYALLNHENDPKPSTGDLPADRPWRENAPLAKKIRANWQDGKLSDDATRDMIAVLREAEPDKACERAVKWINDGVSPQSIWDAVLVGAGELLMQQPGIVGLHGLTASNALRYAYQATSDDGTRRMMLLQNCAFVPLFRRSAQSRGDLKQVLVDDVRPAEGKVEVTSAAVDEIFADISQDPGGAATKVRAFLRDGGEAEALIHAARRLVFLKGRDTHDYKFSSAVLEDYYHVSPQWRDVFLALSVFNLRGSGDRNSGLVERTRAALTQT